MYCLTIAVTSVMVKGEDMIKETKKEVLCKAVWLKTVANIYSNKSRLLCILSAVSNTLKIVA